MPSSHLCRHTAAFALAVAPALALAQLVWKPGDGVDYALAGGARYSSGATVAASAGIGGEAGRTTADLRWRVGAKALWSRVAAGETTTEQTTLLLQQESQHRWRGGIWWRQRLSLSPALRPNEPLRGSVDLGIAMALSRLVQFDLGVTRHYDSAAGWGAGDLRLVTRVALKLD